MRGLMRSIGTALCLLCCCAAHATQAAEPSVTLVYASHLANIQRRTEQGGLAELAGMLRELRRNPAPVLFVDGGNALGPSPLSSFDKGVHMIGLLNLLDPTVMAMGRREFMYKEDELSLRSGEAIFPMVCSNVIDPLTGKQPSGLTRTYLADVGDFAVGFIALVSPELETSYIQDRIKVVGGYDLLAGLNDDLRREGADFVIVTADFSPPGPENDPFRLLHASGADMLIVSEGTATSVRTADGKVYAVQSKENDVFVVDLVAQTPDSMPEKCLRVSEAQAVSLNAYKADDEVAEAIQSYTRSLDSLLSIPVGITKTEIDTSTQSLRIRENAFANLITDAMRVYYGADVALINSGGIRGNQRYAAGTQLVRRDLQAELPLHDISCLTSLSGKDLLAALEYGVSGVENTRGRFLQVSGLHFSYAPKDPAGARIRSVTVGGKPLDMQRSYSISVPVYLAKQGDGYTMFNGMCTADAPRPPQDLLELVRAYIAQHSPVAPKIEGRIITLE